MRLSQACLVIFSLLMGGCDLTASQERETAMRADEVACKSYGYPAGSLEYARCRESRDQQRQDRQTSLVKESIRNNQSSPMQPAATQRSSPPVNCTTVAIGGGMSSTSCQ